MDENERVLFVMNLYHMRCDGMLNETSAQPIRRYIRVCLAEFLINNKVYFATAFQKSGSKEMKKSNLHTAGWTNWGRG